MDQIQNQFKTDLLNIVLYIAGSVLGVLIGIISTFVLLLQKRHYTVQILNPVYNKK
jgi:hypothetical protein